MKLVEKLEPLDIPTEAQMLLALLAEEAGYAAPEDVQEFLNGITLGIPTS